MHVPFFKKLVFIFGLLSFLIDAVSVLKLSIRSSKNSFSPATATTLQGRKAANVTWIFRKTALITNNPPVNMYTTVL